MLEGKNRHLWNLILAPPMQAVSSLSADVDSVMCLRSSWMGKTPNLTDVRSIEPY